MMDKITFPCTVEKVQTMSSGGFRIYIDTPDKPAAAMLLAYSDTMGVTFECELTPVETQNDHDPEQSNGRKSYI